MRVSRSTWEAGGNAIIGHSAYRKATFLAFLGVTGPLVYFITSENAHQVPF